MSTEVNRSIAVGHDFVAEVLRPYRGHCRYLRSVKVELRDSLDDSQPLWQRLVACGEFSIDQSCYIEDTGHFNAVEFNICYNQLAYVHLAYCIQEGLLPALGDFTLESFFAKQLSHYLIGNINSSYHAQIHPRKFFGEVQVVSAKHSSKLSVLRTTCCFTDEKSGRSSGEVKLAVLRP